jgi:hypothetical protein
VTSRILDELIAKHEALTAPAVLPILRGSWEMTPGPEEPGLVGVSGLPGDCSGKAKGSGVGGVARGGSWHFRRVRAGEDGTNQHDPSW